MLVPLAVASERLSKWMSPSTETSWISILVGAAAVGLATLINYVVKRFDPEHERQVRAEEQKAEEETWKRARELIDSYAKERAEAAAKIAKLEVKLDEEIAKRAKLEEELKLEIQRRDEEIAGLKVQIVDRDKQIAELIRNQGGQGKRRGGLTG
jgi:hypothetical protein